MKNIFSLLVISVSLACGGSARAQTHGGACAQDIQKFCSGDTGREIGACLKQNESSLSPGCVTERNAWKAKAEAKLAAILKACSAQVQSECANIPASENQWEVVHCLKTNEKSITDAGCLAALKHPHHHQPE